MEDKINTRCEEAIILDCISDGVVTIGLDMKIRYVNRAMRQLLGYSQLEPIETLNFSCNTLVQCSICSTHDCILEKAIRNREKVTNYETVIQNKDGRRIPVSLNTDLLWDAENNLIGVVETYRDLSQIKELQDKLQRQALNESEEEFIAKSAALKDIRDILPQVANSKATVLIEGESGTGKTLIAKGIHRLSPRANKPFIAINCAALAEGVLESELFGHVKGAFTGAIVDRPGKFEIADRGTLFFDEIAEMSLSTQAKLLRVLQEEEFERVGDNKTRKVDVRIIAATNKDLTQLIAGNKFREDLYYRLRVFPIMLPALRERREDIPALIERYMIRLNKSMDKNIRAIDEPALKFLEGYGYPGNVRELENILEHAFIRCPDNTIRVDHLPQELFSSGNGSLRQSSHHEPSIKDFETMERESIEGLLSETNWNYREVCQTLGISRSTLLRRIKSYGLTRTKKRAL